MRNLIKKILKEQDEFEWARESLRDRPYIPSPNHNRMTVWVFSKDTVNPESKIRRLFDSLEAAGFHIDEDERQQHTFNILNSRLDPYIRTRPSDTVHKYDQISSGSSEDTFIDVVSPQGYRASWIDVHYVR